MDRRSLFVSIWKLPRWAKVVAIVVFAGLVVLIWNPGTLIRPGNPLPRLKSAVLIHPHHGHIDVPDDDLMELRSLFNYSRADPFNMFKWKIMFTIRATLYSGSVIRIDVYSTGQDYWAAFKIGRMYYRGGRRSEFKAFFDRIARTQL